MSEVFPLQKYSQKAPYFTLHVLNNIFKLRGSDFHAAHCCPLSLRLNTSSASTFPTFRFPVPASSQPHREQPFSLPLIALSVSASGSNLELSSSSASRHMCRSYDYLRDGCVKFNSARQQRDNID